MYTVHPDILAVSKALGEETRFAVFQAIADSQSPLTVKDLVARFGMHHSAIRIHLNKLEDAGLIYSQKHHRKGAVGRPQLAFLPSEKALSISLPPRNYQFLARMAIDWLTSDAKADPGDFGETWGREYIRATTHGVDGPQSLDEAMGTLQREIGELGGTPRVADLNGHGFALTEGNCIFGELASRYEPFVCELHQSVLKGMVTELTGKELAWDFTDSLARGDEICRARVTLAD